MEPLFVMRVETSFSSKILDCLGMGNNLNAPTDSTIAKTESLGRQIGLGVCLTGVIIAIAGIATSSLPIALFGTALAVAGATLAIFHQSPCCETKQATCNLLPLAADDTSHQHFYLHPSLAPSNQIVSEKTKTSKTETRTIADLVDHGNLSEERIKQIFSTKPSGSFAIFDGLEGKEKCLMYKEHEKLISLQIENWSNVNKTIFEKRICLKRPVLANNLIQKKSEVINLVSQMIFISDPNEDINLKSKLKEEVAKTKNGVHTFEINGHVFILRRGVDKNYPKAIEINKLSAQFAEGGFGVLYDVEGINIDENDKRAVKLAKETEIAKAYIKSEIEILTLLNGSEGIQMAPYATFEYMNDTGIQIGYLTLKYLTDGFGLAEESPNIKPPLMRQLKVGLTTLHTHKIFCLDIKPENILYNPNTLVLADFGGACKIDAKKEQFEKILKNELKETSLFTPCQPSYISLKFVAKIANIIKDYKRNTKKEIPNFEKEILPILFNINEFSLGLTQFITLTGLYPPFKSFESDELFTGMEETNDKIDQAIETMKETLDQCVSDKDLVKDVMSSITKGLIT